MQWAASTSGRVMLKEPRNDLASPVLELATTTASLMGSPSMNRIIAAHSYILKAKIPIRGSEGQRGGSHRERGSKRWVAYFTKDTFHVPWSTSEPSAPLV